MKNGQIVLQAAKTILLKMGKNGFAFGQGVKHKLLHYDDTE